MTEEEIEALREQLAADVRRVSDRLRSLSEARLAAPCGGFRSAADAGRAAAQAMADAAALVEGDRPRRELPRLSDFAVGDQVAVTGNDLLAVWGALDPAGPSSDEVAAAAALLAEVRRLL